MISGDLTLDNGASTHGGTAGTENQITVGGDATVSNGATLGGNMNVQGTLSGSNGILAPGNSVGTLTVNSVSAFTGTYDAEINAAGKSDEIIVKTGNVDLSGTNLKVTQENGNGGFRINTPYTILETQGGTVQNQFASVDGSAFDTALVSLAPVAYGTDNVQVSVKVDSAKVAELRPSLTPNQSATLDGAESVTGKNAAADAAFTMTSGAAGAFDQLSGESYASTKTALIEDSHYVRDLATERLRSSFSSAAAPSFSATTLDADGKPVAATATSSGVAVWTKGFGAWGHTNGSGGAASASDSTGGVLVGADSLVGDKWRVGGLFGYSHSTFDVDGRSSSAKSDNYHVGVYGGTQIGNLGFRAGAAYTWNSIDASRSINLANYADHTNSSYDAGTAQAFGELGYQLNLGRVALEPFANLAVVSLRTNAFNETGGDAALNSQGDTMNTAFSTLGLHASSDFGVGAADLTLNGTLGWQHVFGNVTPTTSVSFAGGQAFNVAGVPIARDAALVQVGLNANITKKATIGVSYSGQLSSHTENHGFTANFDYKF